ncbi:MAG: FAD-dependent oxidoreductase, partial [Acidobacteria bacterium]|nr:FAD-dependent oxidoreductase [Acidobacteriota bacterium]
MSKKTQAVVIGAGPGGYVAAIRLGQLGVKAILVEKEFVGGVCLNVGCIPSKALIYASHVVDLVKKASRLGIELSEPKVDPVKMQEWKKGVVKKLTSGLEQVIRGNGSEILRGEARLRSQREVEVKTSQGTETLLAEHIVIATGARPAELPDFPCDGDLIIHSTHALELKEIPKRMLVVGGGYIGLELGSLYAKLGTKVTVVEMMDQLLPGFDPEIVRIVAQKLRRAEVTYHVKSRVKGWEKAPSGANVALDVEGKQMTLEVDKILVTVGRKPNSGGLGLEGVGVKVSDRGFIQVDEKLRTNVKTIYA